MCIRFVLSFVGRRVMKASLLVNDLLSLSGSLNISGSGAWGFRASL